MALTVDGLKKSYVSPDGGVTPVLDVAHFALADGEQLALVGGSGSGKTTLLHTIAGIVTPDAGSVVFHSGDVTPRPAGAGGKTVEYKTGTHAGTDLTKLSESQRDVFRGRHIGYVFQTHHLLSGFTALENVLLGMSFTGRAADPKWAKHLLDEVGLGARVNYHPSKLSVGQQQRVAVARALANRPKLVLADEPTGALDPASAQQVLELIRKLCREVGASLILVSHDLGIAKQLERTIDLKELNQRVIGH